MMFRTFATRTLAAALLGVLAAQASADTRLLPENREQITLSFAPLVRSAAPAVVNVYTRKIVRERRANPLLDDPFFRQFFGGELPFAGVPRERVQNSLGSGVIVAPDGVVVTNEHVIEGSDEIIVVLSDRREFDARVVMEDPRTDLAVLRIDPGGEPLPFLELRDSDELDVGDLVLAIGNPFGVGQTVTSGIVSAVARTAAGVSDYNFFIQTDAAINPGNSGGALVSMDGRLVGINSAIYSRTGGSLGIGFAIPSNMVRTVVAAASNGGKLVRPWLGAAGQAVTAEIAASMGLKRPGGVLVSEVDPQSPAGKAGLRVGDVIVALEGREVDGPEALRFRVATLALGSKATLTTWRDGRSRDIAVEIIAPPEDPPRDVRRLGGRQPLAGATVANLSPALAEEIGFADATRGVVVLDVAAGSPAHRLRFQPGDIVREINGRAVVSTADLLALLERATRAWTIAIRRGGQTLTMTVTP